MGRGRGGRVGVRSLRKRARRAIGEEEEGFFFTCSSSTTSIHARPSLRPPAYSFLPSFLLSPTLVRSLTPPPPPDFFPLTVGEVFCFPSSSFLSSNSAAAPPLGLFPSHFQHGEGWKRRDEGGGCGGVCYGREGGIGASSSSSPTSNRLCCCRQRRDRKSLRGGGLSLSLCGTTSALC